MPQCHNCTKAAIIGFGPESVPLCVDCYLKMAQALDIQLAAQERQANHAAAQLEAVAGVPGIVPRYPERKAPVTVAGATFHNITVKDSTVGMVNTGHLQQVDSAISVIGSRGSPELAEAFRRLTEAVSMNTEIAADAQRQALEILSALSSEAAVPKEQRRSAVATPLTLKLREILSVAADLAAIGQATLPLIATALGVFLPH